MIRFCISVLPFFLFPVLASAQLPEGFIREKIATGLNPTSMVMAPDGRIFITEKDGSVGIIKNNVLLDEPMVRIDVDDSNERGLGHIVLHPQFEENGFFYLYYSVFGKNFNRISRFTAIGDKAIPGSEQIIIDLDPMGAEIHNGGAMRFGRDGYLYISTGDGAEGWRAEDISSTNGKMLRVDDNGAPVDDNPWFDNPEGRAKFVYATGLRNPYTMVMHPLTGEMFVNDVGGSKFEEINRIIKGNFYGWPVLEGKRSNQDLPANYQDPVYQYAHSNYYCAIVGSDFYYPVVYQFPPEYHGIYFYSDYCTGHIRMLDVAAGVNKGVFIDDGDRVIDVMVAPDGSLYYLERKGIGDGSPEDNTATNQGTLWKVSYTGSGVPFISSHPANAFISAGEDVSFNVNASGTSPLQYLWYFNDELVHTGSNVLELNDVPLEFDSSEIYAIVQNELGQKTSDTAFLFVTSNQRPKAEILFPTGNELYIAGEKIYFSGSGYDPEEGELPTEALSWKIDFHHDTHTHPAMSWTSGISSGEWQTPVLGETSTDVWYRIHLSVTDTEGMSHVVSKDIHPVTGRLTIHSIPPGLQIYFDGSPLSTPYEIESVAGMKRFVSAPEKQFFGDSVYFFMNWTDGNTSVEREIKASDQPGSLTGNYKGFQKGRGSGLTAYYYANPDLEGTPALIRTDSVLDHQFFFGGPFEGLPEDFFSVKWEGYIQAYKTGEYSFTIVADDGVRLEINDQLLVDQWEPGIHFENASFFFQQGRLYPIRISMFDHQYNSQLRIRWSAEDFDEEIIPYTQLYPVDYLSSKTVFGKVNVASVTQDQLRIRTESFQEVVVRMDLYAAGGQSMYSVNEIVSAGRNIISIDISGLTPGVYFLSVQNKENNETSVIKFLKPF